MRGFWSHVKLVATANSLASVVLLPALPAPWGGLSGHWSAKISQVAWLVGRCCFPP